MMGVKLFDLSSNRLTHCLSHVSTVQAHSSFLNPTQHTHIERFKITIASLGNSPSSVPLFLGFLSSERVSSKPVNQP